MLELPPDELYVPRDPPVLAWVKLSQVFRIDVNDLARHDCGVRLEGEVLGEVEGWFPTVHGGWLARVKFALPSGRAVDEWALPAQQWVPSHALKQHRRSRYRETGGPRRYG